MSTHLENELRSQPDVASRFADRAPAEIRALRTLARDTGGVLLAARGSSDNAARYAQYLIPLRSGRPVALATPSLSTVYGARPDTRGQLVVAVSQSGTSPDVVSVLADARAQGSPTLAVTNDPSSALAREADHVLDLAAGQERSVAATKTYTASLLAMALLATALDPGGDPGVADLHRVPAAMAGALDVEAGRAAAARFGRADRGFAVGRGLNLCTACEAALKITELTGSLVVPFSPADLRHGPVGAAGPGTPTLLIVPDEAASASVREVADELTGRGAPVLTIGPGGDLDPPAVPGWLTPLVSVVSAQVLAWQLAVARGVDVDAPAGLNKITTTR